MEELIDPKIISKYSINFLLILVRTSIFFVMLPTFSSKNFPGLFKISLAVAFALFLTPIVEVKIGENDIAILVLKELIMGIVIGLAVRFVFAAIDMAGTLISNSMALSIATAFDPEFGQSAEVARLLTVLATMVFFAMDAHHDLIYLMVKSFDVVPFGQVNVKGLMLKGTTLVSKAFVLALKMGAPVVVGMVVINLLIGFLYKAAPQINIFFVSYPLFLFFGFVLLLIGMPEFTKAVGGFFLEIKEEINRILYIARG